MYPFKIAFRPMRLWVLKTFRINNSVIIKQVLHSWLVTGKLPFQSYTQTHDVTVIKNLFLRDVNTPKQTGLQSPRYFGGVNGICFHHGFVLSRRNIGSMNRKTFYTKIQQWIISGEATETGLISGQIITVGIMFLQMFKERLGGRLLAVLFQATGFGEDWHMPSLQMNVNTYIDILTFKI